MLDKTKSGVPYLKPISEWTVGAEAETAGGASENNKHLVPSIPEFSIKTWKPAKEKLEQKSILENWSL